jgi:hypothetical protein
MKLKCVVKECEATGEAIPGYRFFMCEACLNKVDQLAGELDDARNGGRTSLEDSGHKS